jgi:hypothetical protein
MLKERSLRSILSRFFVGIGSIVSRPAGDVAKKAATDSALEQSSIRIPTSSQRAPNANTAKA